MWASAFVYVATVIAAAAAVLAVKPVRRFRITRARALMVAVAGGLLAVAGLFLPAGESRVSGVATRLDEFAPVWQFHEVHEIRIPASPEQVFAAIKRVRADEIRFFHALTWIRRGGRQAPPSILNAGERESIIDVALASGFVSLADDPPRELVIGTVVVAPPGTRGTLTPQVFRKPLPPGFALATMNFLVRPDGHGHALVSTETRVFANSPSSRRRFAAYWRIIYPGSAIIRRMWLRAIQQRAMAESERLRPAPGAASKPGAAGPPSARERGWGPASIGE
jgi:hypothetical protein